MSEISINIEDLVNLKKIEPGDVLVLHENDDGPDSFHVLAAIRDAIGCFVIVSPKSYGPIEKITREQLDQIAGVMGLELRPK